jgi:hypothetical protein
MTSLYGSYLQFVLKGLLFLFLPPWLIPALLHAGVGTRKVRYKVIIVTTTLT